MTRFSETSFALSAIFLFQLHCLHHLCETRTQETEESIRQALRIADYNEIVLRLRQPPDVEAQGASHRHDMTTHNHYLHISREQLQRLSSMVEQILSLSMERRKGFVLNRESIAVKEVVEAVVAMHRLKSERPLAVAVDVSPTDLTLLADRTQLMQMLSNLLDNAIKYSPVQPDITIRSWAADDGTAFLSVRDHGIGIAPEQQRHIFEKFYRVPQGNLHAVKDYGLGLHYVSAMMHLHGGSISVASTLGNGSTFTLTFPKPNAHTLSLFVWLLGGMLISFL